MTTIDWTKPVETIEDPPRPVRVLCMDNDLDGYPIVAMVGRQPIMFTAGGFEWVGGTGLRLRNVALPKPEPVLWEAWVNLYATGNTGAPCASRAEVEAMANPGRVECRRIAWMSDGSLVEGEGHTNCWANYNLMLIDRDHWKLRAEAAEAARDEARALVEELQQEVNVLLAEAEDYRTSIRSMRPVVEAAMSWFQHGHCGQLETFTNFLVYAIRVYEAKQAEPMVESCSTCARCPEHESQCVWGTQGICVQPDRRKWQIRTSEKSCETCCGNGMISMGNGMYPDCPDCGGTEIV